MRQKGDLRRKNAAQLYSWLLSACLDAGVINDERSAVTEIIENPARVYELLEALDARVCRICGVTRGKPHHPDFCGLKDDEWPEE